MAHGYFNKQNVVRLSFYAKMIYMQDAGFSVRFIFAILFADGRNERQDKMDDIEVLRQFDLEEKYGPCLGLDAVFKYILHGRRT